jgi:hypothetical protein
MQKLPGFKWVVWGRTQELLWIFLNFCKELLQIEGNAFELAGFGEEAHDMAVSEKELVADTVLGKWNVIGSDRIVKPVQGHVALPNIAQGMPLWLRTHSSYVECALQENEAIGLRKELLQRRWQRGQEGLIIDLGSRECHA